MAQYVSKFVNRLRKPLRAVGFGVASSTTQQDSAVPTITSGTGAPTATAPDGSVYLRTDPQGPTSSIYFWGGGAWRAVLIPTDTNDDPGTGRDLVDSGNSLQYALTSAGAGETRNLLDPQFGGQTVDILHAVDGGDIDISVSAGINKAGNTNINLADEGDFIRLVAIDADGAGNLRWQVVVNDGCTLS